VKQEKSKEKSNFKERKGRREVKSAWSNARFRLGRRLIGKGKKDDSSIEKKKEGMQRLENEKKRICGPEDPKRN